MHEDPQIPNFATGSRGAALLKGMTLAIEPMITAGGPGVVVHDDEWSISTADGSLSVHFEHTVAVLGEGPRVLTARERARAESATISLGGETWRRICRWTGNALVRARAL